MRYLLGYNDASKEYKIYNLQSWKIVVTKDVIFGEYVMGMPYLKENKLLDMASEGVTTWPLEYLKDKPLASHRGKMEKETTNKDQHEANGPLVHP